METSTNNDDISLSNAYISRIRQYLHTISEQEKCEGIPVGVILISREHAGLLRYVSYNSRKLIRYKKVHQLTEDNNYFIMHLSTISAAAFAFDREKLHIEEFFNSCDVSYYPGIRLYDPLISTLSLQNFSQFNRNNNSSFTFAEIFAGIGGFRIGLEQIGGQCVFASEIDEAARLTYINNFGGNELIGDITEVYANQLPSFDMLTAGFPCQTFSTRGKKAGLNDPRGQLYLELVRILKYCQPKCFLFENVSSLVTMDGGKRNKKCEPLSKLVKGPTFELIMKAFEDTGYNVSYDIINSKYWVPQMRERVYIIGFRKDLNIHTIDWSLDLKRDWYEDINCNPTSLSTKDYNSSLDNDLTANDIINDEDIIYDNENDTSIEYSKYESPNYCPLQVRDILEDPNSEAIADCVLTTQQWNKLQSEEFKTKSSAWQASIEMFINRKAPTLTSGYHNVGNFTTRYIFEEKDGTIRDIPRFLTNRECARIMGFPDSYKMETNGKRFYHQIGNAVCPPVIQSIGQKMINVLTHAGNATNC